MLKFISRFQVVALMLICSFVLQTGTIFAEVDTPTETPATETVAEEDAPKPGCDNPYSLFDALKNAQNVETDKVRIPNGLPGASRNRSVGTDSAIAGFAGLLQRIINGLTAVAASVAVFFIVFNGGGMMLAMGDSEKIKKARMGIMWALIGLLLIMASYIIAKTVISLTYSGGNTQIEGQNTLDNDCEEDEDEVITETAPATCVAVPAIPAGCYEGYGSQLRDGFGTKEECRGVVEADLGFQAACDGILDGTSCTVKNIQFAIRDHYSERCPAPAAFPNHDDGDYGDCTVEAINAYYTNPDVCPKEGKVGDTVEVAALGTITTDDASWPRIYTPTDLSRVFDGTYGEVRADGTQILEGVFTDGEATAAGLFEYNTQTQELTYIGSPPPGI